MAKRKQYLWPFLKAEGLLEHVEQGIRAVCEFRDAHVDWTVSVRGYLLGVEVRPTRALTRYGSASPRGAGLIRITSLDISGWKRRDTILHEIAHLVTHHLYARTVEPHGKQWRAVATLLGAEPSATGADPVFAEAIEKAREKRLKIVARCAECGYEILATRRTSKYTGTRYNHRGCGGLIVVVD
jgi:hypothetical protein